MTSDFERCDLLLSDDDFLAWITSTLYLTMTWWHGSHLLISDDDFLTSDDDFLISDDELLM